MQEITLYTKAGHVIKLVAEDMTFSRNGFGDLVKMTYKGLQEFGGLSFDPKDIEFITWKPIENKEEMNP